MRVGFFVTCLVDSMRPRIGFAAIKLLEAAGCEVVVPEQQPCCGRPATTRATANPPRPWHSNSSPNSKHSIMVVLPSGSCGGMIRVHYPELFKDDPALLARFVAVGARTFELTDFLLDVAQAEKNTGHISMGR